MQKSIEVRVKESSYVLVLGVGGGDDIVETLSTSRIERNYIWKRYVGSDRLEGKK